MTHAEATRRFYAHIWPLRAMLLRTASFLTSSGSEAEDLVQETLMKAFGAMASFDERSNAAAWLAAILRHSRIDRLRAFARAPTVSLEHVDVEIAAEPAVADAAVPRDPAEADAALEEFSDETVIRALRQLPEEIRWTLLLVDIDELDYQQAARILEIPAGTVKSRLHRGRLMLREALMREQPDITRWRGAR